MISLIQWKIESIIEAIMYKLEHHLPGNLNLRDPKKWRAAAMGYLEFAEERLEETGSNYYTRANSILNCGLEYAQRWMWHRVGNGQYFSKKHPDYNIYSMRQFAKDHLRFKTVGKCPYNLSLRILFPEEILSEKIRAKYSHVLKYADRYGVTPEFLPGFIYSVGGIDKAMEKGSNLKMTDDECLPESWVRNEISADHWNDFMATADKRLLNKKPLSSKRKKSRHKKKTRRLRS